MKNTSGFRKILNIIVLLDSIIIIKYNVYKFMNKIGIVICILYMRLSCKGTKLIIYI